jgi:polysaccharide biosynthesis/export protein
VSNDSAAARRRGSQTLARGGDKLMAPMPFRATRMLLTGLLLVVAGCSTMPVQGPTVHDVNSSAAEGRDFTIVKLTPAVVQKIETVPPPSFVATFGDNRPAPITMIQTGDILQITIWDAGGGLFSPQGPAQLGTQTTPIPNQTVDPKGDISLPFVDRPLHVDGKSTVEAQRMIARALANQALKPQALVTIVQDQSNLVSVVGDVKNPQQLVLNVNGTRILDAIARAGGTTAPAYDTVAQLTRNGVTKRERLSWLIEHQSENIYLHPQDVLYVVTTPEFVAVLGATKMNMRFPFDAEQLTLAEVLGQSGGLLDLQAEPTGVYVFRVEPAGLVAGLSKDAPAAANGNAAVPVLFQADLREPRDYFLAQSFQMHDKDIVYVANAETVQLDKLLRIILHASEIVGILFNKNGVVSAE